MRICLLIYKNISINLNKFNFVNQNQTFDNVPSNDLNNSLSPETLFETNSLNDDIENEMEEVKDGFDFEVR